VIRLVEHDGGVAYAAEMLSRLIDRLEEIEVPKKVEKDSPSKQKRAFDCDESWWAAPEEEERWHRVEPRAKAGGRVPRLNPDPI
jgi:hypothetical protein